MAVRVHTGDEVAERPGSATGRKTQEFMSEKTELPSEPPVRCIRLVGRCIEVGDDDEGQPRLIIHTTREQLMRFGRNLVYVDVDVTLHSPNGPDQRPPI